MEKVFKSKFGNLLQTKIEVSFVPVSECYCEMFEKCSKRLDSVIIRLFSVKFKFQCMVQMEILPICNRKMGFLVHSTSS